MSQPGFRSKKRATIKDVAQAADVSVTTVSNVLNGRTSAMSPETLQRIRDTMQTLNYRPSQVARSLVTNNTATIGLIIAEIDTPLFLQAINIIEPVARNAEYNILLSITATNLKDEPQAIELLLEKQVDGLIILSTSAYYEQNYLATLPDSAPPIVLVNRSKVYGGRFSQISFDHSGGVVKAVDYLVQLGHRYIAHLTGPEGRHSTTERLRGYRQGLDQNGLEYRNEFVRQADYEQASTHWEDAARAVLAAIPRPTAIIAANDRVAAIVARTIQQAGLRVPQDISVIGIDNQPLCMYLNPTLTTIQMPIEKAGELAINLLLDKISGKRTTLEHIVIPCPLIIRESSDKVAAKETAQMETVQ